MSTLVISMVAQANTLVVGVLDFPPYIHVKDGKTFGRGINFIKNTFGKRGYKIKYKFYPSRRAAIELKNGGIDFLLPLFKEEKSAGDNFFLKPLFYSVPGLCFKKENFIPILSATHRFKNLRIGHKFGLSLVAPLKDSGAEFKPLIGVDTFRRGMKMLMSNRIDSFYHPDPARVSGILKEFSSDVACSYFYGNATGMYIRVSPNLRKEKSAMLEKIYNNGNGEIKF
jgi:hypothetical protein